MHNSWAVSDLYQICFMAWCVMFEFLCLFVCSFKGLLSMDWSVGIMGGRPTHSLFFVGWQGEHMRV